MHDPNSGANSFFKLSRIKPKIFSTQAVSCCLNNIAGYLASKCDIPSPCLNGDVSPCEYAIWHLLTRLNEQRKTQRAHIQLQLTCAILRAKLEDPAERWVAGKPFDRKFLCKRHRSADALDSQYGKVTFSSPAWNNCKQFKF